MQEINFSFVIPHKNSPMLLERCIRSIPSRDDIEIIIIDDASDDSYVKSDSFPGVGNPIVKIHFAKEPRGAGPSRNIGLDLALGKWIIFADADDYFNFCLDECLGDYLNSNSDIVFFKANSVDSVTYTNSYRALQLNRFIDLYKNDPLRGANLLRYRFGEPWAKMIKRSVIVENEIKFDETIIHNDTMFSLLVGYCSKDIEVDDRALYCCTTRRDSISFSTSNEKRLARIWVFARVELFFDKKRIGINKIYKHVFSLTYFFFTNQSYFKKGLGLMHSLNIPTGMVFLKMIYTFPYFLLDLNKNWLRKLIFKTFY